MVSNLEHKNAYAIAATTRTANCTFLSGVHAKLTEGTDYELGTTVDQIAAQQLGKDTPLPSLELATDFNYVVGNCDNGYSCVYMNTLSWSTPTTPLPTEANPRVVFERMFGDGGTAADRQRELRKSGSILDWVTERHGAAAATARCGRSHAGRRLSRLGARNRAAHSEGRTAGWRRRCRRSSTRPIGVPPIWEDHAKLMFDLQVLALQADITRVITFQMAREVSTRTYPQIGVPEAHHPMSHHQNEPEKLAKLAKINAYHVSLFAYFLEKLEGDAGRRRLAARPLDVSARQRDGQPGCARSLEPADPGRGRRSRSSRAAATSSTRSRRRCRTCCRRCSTRWACDRAIRRQHRQRERADRAAPRS